MTASYLIYGANGYTGELVAREASARGQTPVLAGRDAAAVRRLAEELRLPHRAFGLDDPAAREAGLADVAVVLNCAGPFAHTADSMTRACVQRHVHYLDVTGEVAVFEALAARDAEFRAAGITVLPGVGFDVVPTDCLAAHLKRRLPDATDLTLGFQALGRLSRGTAISTIESIGRPNLMRRDGVITEVPMGAHARDIDFGRGATHAVAIPWGDVSMAYHSTGIPNIAVYVAQPRWVGAAMRWNERLAPVLRSKPVQQTLKRLARAGRSGPTEAQRARGRSYVWGEARDAAGTRVVSRMVTPEAYALTVLAALAAVDKVLRGEAPVGFQTPSRAFGPDFALELPGVTRADA